MSILKACPHYTLIRRALAPYGHVHTEIVLGNCTLIASDAMHFERQFESNQEYKH